MQLIKRCSLDLLLLAVPVTQIIRIFQHELEKGWRDPKIGKLFLEILFDDPEIFNAE